MLLIQYAWGGSISSGGLAMLGGDIVTKGQ